jgi:hypothetical protein
MKIVPFVWTEQTSLRDEFAKPIRFISVEFHRSWPQYVTLWHSDGTGIRIHSEMVDIADRLEVGVLHFHHIVVSAHAEVSAKLPWTLGTVVAVSKLVIAESGSLAESGIVIATEVGELVVVANAFPCNLAIHGLPLITETFEPEYPLNSYEKVSLS